MSHHLRRLSPPLLASRAHSIGFRCVVCRLCSNLNLNRHTRYRPATTARNTATQRSRHVLRKGQLVESTHKVPTSHSHTNTDWRCGERGAVESTAGLIRTSKNRVGDWTQSPTCRTCTWRRTPSGFSFLFGRAVVRRRAHSQPRRTKRNPCTGPMLPDPPAIHECRPAPGPARDPRIECVSRVAVPCPRAGGACAVRMRGAARPRVRPACSDAERRDYSPAVPTTQFTNPLENLQLPHLQYSL